MIYTAPVPNVFYVGLNITRGLCPGNLEFFVPQMESLDFQGPPS